MKEKENLRKEKGITLIALVVTIVVLIILAGVSISLVLGENGIITQAQIAKQQSQKSSAIEQAKIDILAWQTEQMQNNKNVELTDSKVKEILTGKDYVKDGKPGTTSFITSEGEHEILYSELYKSTTTNLTVASKWDLNKVEPVISEDNKMVPVPKGYTASKIKGEKSVDSGFVIKEGNDGLATSGINEFVWVPVPEISDVYDVTNNAGQLWNFGTEEMEGIVEPSLSKINNSTTKCGEPNIVTVKHIYDEFAGDTSNVGGDTEVSNLEAAGFLTTDTDNDLNKDGTIDVEDFKIQLQSEFNEMVESVDIYGGFYIGRYETGNLSESTAVVQKENIDIENQTWYTQYKVSKTISANNNVASTMIWGCQWDATLRWMQTSSVEKVKNFATDTSNKYGNFKSNSIEYIESGQTKKTKEEESVVIPTGSAEITNINNIYDMAGNVSELTMETAYGGYALFGMIARVRRGSDVYNAYGYDYAARRVWSNLDNMGLLTDFGSRASLYVK